MKKVDLMIFDLDGTLVSSGADLIQSINYTLDALKLEKKREKEILSFVGDGVRKSYPMPRRHNENFNGLLW
jgi:phosphoglycolate phosphatase